MARDQHPSFGKELRALICSVLAKDKELAGIILSELKALDACKRLNQKHPKETRLHGDHLKHVQCLELYKGGNSIRIYFVQIEHTVWMIAVNENKRATKLTKGMEAALIARSEQVTKLHEAKRLRAKKVVDTKRVS